MTPSTETRRALQALRERDRPDVDPEAMLKKFMADAPTLTPARPPRWPAWAGVVGLCALAALGARAWSPSARVAPRTAAPADEAPARTRAAPITERPEAALALVDPSSAPTPAATRTPPARVRVGPITTSADEWALLREVNQALQAHEQERALRLLDQHARVHPRSAATPEAMAYRVRAHCMAGRVAVASAVAGELRALAPSSPAAYSLRATCAADGSR